MRACRTVERLLGFFLMGAPFASRVISSKAARGMSGWKSDSNELAIWTHAAPPVWATRQNTLMTGCASVTAGEAPASIQHRSALQ